MNSFGWTLAFVASFLLAMLAFAVGLGGNIALGVTGNGWWLLLGIPVGVVAFAGSLHLCNWLLNEA